MKKEVIVGIDPGEKGGIAFFSRDGTLLDVEPMPLDAGTKEVDSLALFVMLSEAEPLLVVVEKVGSNPKWRSNSIFTFGRNLEAVISTLKIAEIPYDCNVLPTTWKKVVLAGTKREKADAIAHVHRRYPEFADKVGKHDGMADATCIGEYGLRVLLGGSQCP